MDGKSRVGHPSREWLDDITDCDTVMSVEEVKSSKEIQHKKVTIINIPEVPPLNGNWKTIDLDALYDTEKRYLTKCDLDDVYRILESSSNGLTDNQINERLAKFGSNTIEHKDRNPIIQFFLFMWNPLSWVMEAAAIVAIALSNGGGEPPDWPDFIGIVLLLLINATIGYIEKYRAGNAVKALMASLAPECRVKRNNGIWSTIQARELVPGDIVAIKLGNIVPADARIVSSPGGTISLDQAALTGESLPASKTIGDTILSSTICKQGECEAIIIATGINTEFGRAAKIVDGVRDEVGHLQMILAKIGNFCIVGIAIFIIAEIFVMYVGFRYSYRQGINNILVLLIGGLPIAMPTVLSVTLAIGAKELSARKAIVTRITAIEELAAVTILCSDKTGTLTQNKLVIDKDTIVKYTDVEPNDIIRYAAYACNQENSDAIDTCVLDSFGKADSIDEMIIVKSFCPFDPTTKRTEVIYQEKSSIKVKMITGDQLEIAKETGRRLGMGDVMYVYEDIINSKDGQQSSIDEDKINETVLEADGFASVFPNHKFEIVERLQDMGHLVAMTGDGVNDAPALAKANVGVAVSDACDAARSAAAIVLTEPGLSIIIDAVHERPTLLLIAAFVITQLCTTLIAVYANWTFTEIVGCGWAWAGIVWIYNLICTAVENA
ncbi:unnamed protein product [Rotaria sordida]|uniref:P-type Ca(2+) transporter n=1 Tax=Rotaria sordida TaxID=392033 RepID=A0A813RB56_9BILA|nr:unnamed protein product [Rotaria sordida]